MEKLKYIPTISIIFFSILFGCTAQQSAYLQHKAAVDAAEREYVRMLKIKNNVK